MFLLCFITLIHSRQKNWEREKKPKQNTFWKRNKNLSSQKFSTSPSIKRIWLHSVVDLTSCFIQYWNCQSQTSDDFDILIVVSKAKFEKKIEWPNQILSRWSQFCVFFNCRSRFFATRSTIENYTKLGLSWQNLVWPLIFFSNFALETTIRMSKSSKVWDWQFQ